MASTTITRSLIPAVERFPFWRTRLGAWLKAKLGVGRRYGVRFNAGRGERMGFHFRWQAAKWARNAPQVADFLVFDYEPLEVLLAVPKARDGRYLPE